MFTVLAISEYSLGEGNGNPLQCSLPGESQGGGSLVGRCLWGRTESDTTEATQQQQQQHSVLNDFDSYSFLFPSVFFPSLRPLLQSLISLLLSV